MTSSTKTPLSHSEVDEHLRSHEVWLKSGYKDGVRADFSDKAITGYNFTGKSLIWVSFYNARLKNCGFTKTSLNDAYFAAAEIVRCDFSEAKLDNVDFSWSNIQGCIFTDSTHLTVKSFKRANLKGTIFPEGFSFEGAVTYTDHLIKKARNVFGIGLGFSITTLLLLLFSNDSVANTITLPLPLLSKEISLDIHTGLLLNFVILIILGIFYSLSLSAIKKQLDKIPAVFPDGRLAYETVFPWFWVTWIGEIWQTDYKNASGPEKHLLWSRLLVLSSVVNIFFVTIFTLILLALRQCNYLPTLIDNYKCAAIGLITILFAVTISAAYKSRERFYACFAGVGALAIWSILYFITGFDYTLLVALTMIIAWWCDTLVYSNEPFAMDMSVPESNYASDLIKAMHAYVQPRFDGMNIALGLVFCLLTAVYVFYFKT